METGRRIEGLIDFIAERYGNAAEIGIGHFSDVALGLRKRGVEVFATDIMPYVYEGLNVFLDDVTAPKLFLYEGIDLLYAMRPPAELVPHIADLAKTIAADVIIKPLSSEYPEGWRLLRNGDSIFFIKKGISRPCPSCPSSVVGHPFSDKVDSLLGSPRRVRLSADESPGVTRPQTAGMTDY